MLTALRNDWLTYGLACILTALHTDLLTGLLIEWQEEKGMAFLTQRAGRWSLRGHSIKTRQVNLRTRGTLFLMSEVPL